MEQLQTYRLISAEMSRLRVAERVAHGGHRILDADIVRRFPCSLYNLFNEFAPKVDQAKCYMNRSTIPKLVFQQEGATCNIFHSDFFDLLQQEAQA
ncbi:MAG: hypothetical protein HOP02_01920 [Methylococcaceae bacterium]|nr:hypothetical protein [Methylococcaceae bacterium]